MKKGHDLWLGYTKIKDSNLLDKYRNQLREIIIQEYSLVFNSIKTELQKGLSEILDQDILMSNELSQAGVMAATFHWLEVNYGLGWAEENINLSDEGFVIRSICINGKSCIVISGKTDVGILYGSFRFLSFLQCNKNIDRLNVVEQPAHNLRMLNHWDNWDGSIERGYAGKSIWKWDKLPHDVDPIYRDYARACSSVGINAAVINNVNAQTDFIKSENLSKVAALADILREYGIILYLSVSFDSPVLIGKLPTADPLDSNVIDWWERKIKEIYGYIPDFGGFLIKADSEGRPGPNQYGRTHTEGANMLGAIIKKYGGLIIWRAFVYPDTEADRIKRAYSFFKPLDGQFADEVILQVKNGPLDFQVREAVSPLFGAMPETKTGLEFQITQEYTGQSVHLCWLIPQWKEVLDFDTKVRGDNSSIKRITDGSLFNYSKTLIAGVSNIGSDFNWTGHLLAQGNWYGFGRIAWNPDISSEQIADEWIRMTFGNDMDVVKTIKNILLNSWKIYESYTAPLGIGLMCDAKTHFRPAPASRVRYHQADHDGIGYDRTRETGSGYVDQYHPWVADLYNDPELCPQELLLWFHHLPYHYVLESGKTIITQIYDKIFEGVNQAEAGLHAWNTLLGIIDLQCFESVQKLMKLQLQEAKIWKNELYKYYSNLSGIEDKRFNI